MDTIPSYNNTNHTGQFRNQRAITVAGAKENVGSPIVQQNGIQCFNCKEFAHFAKECRKPKRVKDSTYHKKRCCCASSNTCLVEKDDSDVTPDSPDMCENDI
nr:hypothetical protein [Tanacetum cinerariifolium]